MKMGIVLNLTTSRHVALISRVAIEQTGVRSRNVHRSRLLAQSVRLLGSKSSHPEATKNIKLDMRPSKSEALKHSSDEISQKRGHPSTSKNETSCNVEIESRVILYTDGCYKGKSKTAGIGVFSPDHPELNMVEPALFHPFTSQRAEFEAVIRAIMKCRSLKLPTLRLCTDCERIVRFVNEYYSNPTLVLAVIQRKSKCRDKDLLIMLGNMLS